MTMSAVMLAQAGSPSRFVPSSSAPVARPVVTTPTTTENGLPFSGGNVMPASVSTTMLTTPKPTTARIDTMSIPVTADITPVGTAHSRNATSCGPSSSRYRTSGSCRRGPQARSGSVDT